MEELLKMFEAGKTISWNDMFILNVKREWACELPMANMPYSNEILAEMKFMKKTIENSMDKLVISNAEHFNTTVNELSDYWIEQGVWVGFDIFVKHLVKHIGYKTGDYSPGELDSDLIIRKILLNKNDSNTVFFKSLINQTLKRIKKGGEVIMKITKDKNMLVKFNKNKLYKDTSTVRNELVVNGIVTHTASPSVVFHTNVSKAYKKFEKKLNKHIGKKIKFTDTVTNKSYTGYYFGLCENTNGRDGVSYFLANTEKDTKPFTTFPYGIINEFIYSITE